MRNYSLTNKWFLTFAIAIAIFFAACSANNVKIDDSIKQYFDEYHATGSFGLYENGTGDFIIYNLKRYKDSAYLPASTFKIVNALVGLETGIIINEKMIIPWNGKTTIFPNGDTAKAWNKNLTMEEAFKVSSVPYFQEVAKRIGKDTMKQWIDSIKYGNHTIGNELDRFWLNNTLKITADEQLGLVKKLFFGQLPFQKRTQDIVRRVMLQESNANYQLSYKTGMGTLPNGKSLGWVVGWIEENKHPYFFVLNVETDAKEPMQQIRLNILTKILKQQGFLEGKR